MLLVQIARPPGDVGRAPCEIDHMLAGAAAGLHDVTGFAGQKAFGAGSVTVHPSARSYGPQPGVGRLIKAANPQVVPIFIAGLGNKLAKQVLRNWLGGEPIRIHFGKQLDLSEYIAKKDHVRTYKEIGEFVMSKIAELGDADRQMYSDGEKL